MENKNLILLIFLISSSLVFAQTPEEKISLHLNYWILVCYCLLIFIIAGIVALILAISGIRIFTNENIYEREEAKKKAKYAIIALIFILISCPLVNFLIKGGDVKEFRCECSDIIGGGSITTTTQPLWTTTRITTKITTTKMTTTHMTTKMTTTTKVTTSSMTTTTFEGIKCVEECINENFVSGKCRTECKDYEIDFGTADDCLAGEICCCIPSPSVTTTTIPTPPLPPLPPI